MSGSTLDILSKSVAQISEELEDLAEQCAEGLLKVDELKQKIKETEQKLSNLLPERSVAHRIFDREKKEIDPWWQETRTGYVEQSHCEKLLRWRKLLVNILEHLHPVAFSSEYGGVSQYFLEADDVYRAVKLVLRVMRRANTELIIVDPYLDGSIFEYLDELNNGVAVKLITSNKKPIFTQLLHSRPTSLKSAVSARECGDSHDRFILIDGAELWHLGGFDKSYRNKGFNA